MDEQVDQVSSPAVSHSFARLVAHTRDVYCRSVAETTKVEILLNGQKPPHSSQPNKWATNHFISLQWTSSGAFLLSANADNILRTFAFPTDNLMSKSCGFLRPMAAHPFPQNMYAIAACSWTEDHATAVVSVADIPLQLIDFYPDGSTKIVGSFVMWRLPGEDLLKAYSLAWDSDRNYLIAGLKSCVAIADPADPQAKPTYIRTCPMRKARGYSPSVVHGLVHALSSCPTERNVFAIGTTGRGLALADRRQRDLATAVKVVDDPLNWGITGNGITSINWDSHGQYLLVSERHSDGIQLWDLRYQGRCLAYLQG
ncbi:hypothetical protein BDY21DRAFT_376786, partial [Lineolata rhizophorae]